ncbi:hypothetical protein RQM65_06395 [Pricia sp. S334]|uniref:Uncharacterized protein n=1 Tax=Pricia mediterranea TaxID=3076079 RepID=A0ABU3L4D3_9FLAO|nr:hypothetical protein [Pricia sp. S334]MDT7828287.1 hypothetical protein [Pricia sp. S334]
MKELICEKSKTAGGTSFFLLLGLLFLSGCTKDRIDPNGIGPGTTSYSLASAQSIFIDSGKLLITGYANNSGHFSTRYWADSISIDRSEFIESVDNGTVFRESVDESYRTVYSYKDLKGENQKYRFDQGSLFRGGQNFFYKNDSIITLDTIAIGTVSSLSFLEGAPYYAGYFGKIVKTEAGDALSPVTPFIWNGGPALLELPLPSEEAFFQGTSNVHVEGPNEFYVGSRGSLPAYWKNTEPIVLDTRYGEVWQVTKSGTDVYAVGLINKDGSNSTGHTACYWKNEELVELEEDAQAYGIFVDGDDIYVSGSVGRVPVEYTPCFWKNGIRVDLPFHDRK